jgi:selenocysteine lyase/cysteine desulfurase
VHELGLPPHRYDQSLRARPVRCLPLIPPSCTTRDWTQSPTANSPRPPRRCRVLNNASTGPLPESSLRALAEFDALRAEPWTISFERQFGTAVRSRELIARLIGASPSEIALMTNTSYGLNLAARMLPLSPGDVVLTSDREFPSNVYPWMAVERTRGVRFQAIPCDGRLLDEGAVLAALDQPGVRVLVLSWVSFETGYAIDLERIGQACAARGIYFVVDAIQGVGALTLDLSQLHVDILACGCQKWLVSPLGTAFVYVRQALISARAERLGGCPCATRTTSHECSTTTSRIATMPGASGGDAPSRVRAVNVALDLCSRWVRRIAARVAEHVDRLVRWAEDASDTCSWCRRRRWCGDRALSRCSPRRRRAPRRSTRPASCTQSARERFCLSRTGSHAREHVARVACSTARDDGA